MRSLAYASGLCCRAGDLPRWGVSGAPVRREPTPLFRPRFQHLFAGIRLSRMPAIWRGLCIMPAASMLRKSDRFAGWRWSDDDTGHLRDAARPTIDTSVARCGARRPLARKTAGRQRTACVAGPLHAAISHRNPEKVTTVMLAIDGTGAKRPWRSAPLLVLLRGASPTFGRMTNAECRMPNVHWQKVRNTNDE